MKFVYYLKSIFSTFFILISTAIASTSAVLLTLFYTPAWVPDFIYYNWARSLVALGFIKIEIIGRESLPAGGCLFLFNHTSYMDIPILLKSLHSKHARFGAKIELFKIPIFGRAMRKLGTLPIVRHNRSGVLKLYQQSIQRVHNGESFILAPEGTRQETDQLGNFKSGPFIFAIEGQFPIVPVVIMGAHFVQPKGKRFPNSDRLSRTVQVHILSPVSSEGFTLEQRPILQDKVRQAMVQVVDEKYESYIKQYEKI